MMAARRIRFIITGTRSPLSREYPTVFPQLRFAKRSKTAKRCSGGARCLAERAVVSTRERSSSWLDAVQSGMFQDV